MTVATDAGTLALWRGSAFADVDGYDAWERRVNERLDEAIQSGELVPVGIQGDGAFGVRVAVAPDTATERETRYTVVTSQPYLLVSDGGPVHLSGMEAVGVEASSPITVSLPEGHYAVRASIVGRGARRARPRWAAGPGRTARLPGDHRADRWPRVLPHERSHVRPAHVSRQGALICLICG